MVRRRGSKKQATTQEIQASIVECFDPEIQKRGMLILKVNQKLKKVDKAAGTQRIRKILNNLPTQIPEKDRSKHQKLINFINDTRQLKHGGPLLKKMDPRSRRKIVENLEMMIFQEAKRKGFLAKNKRADEIYGRLKSDLVKALKKFRAKSETKNISFAGKDIELLRKKGIPEEMAEMVAERFRENYFYEVLCAGKSVCAAKAREEAIKEIKAPPSVPSGKFKGLTLKITRPGKAKKIRRKEAVKYRKYHIRLATTTELEQELETLKREKSVLGTEMLEYQNALKRPRKVGQIPVNWIRIFADKQGKKQIEVDSSSKTYLIPKLVTNRIEENKQKIDIIDDIIKEVKKKLEEKSK